jgi:hypothetical protein
MVQRIFLSDFFHNQIVTRQAMTEFFDYVSRTPEKVITLDFSKINFISRSCADEYIKRKLNSKKTIYEEKISQEVKRMFDIASLQFKKSMGIYN